MSRSGWRDTRLKFLADLRSGAGITSASIDEQGPYPVFGGNGLRGYALSHTHDGEHVLIGRQGALCGNVHRVSGRFWASEHAVVATMWRDVDADWYAYLTSSMNLGQYSVAAAQPGLAVDRVRDLPVRCPPLEVQRAIADFLDRKTAAIDALIGKKERLLALLAEQRAALIHRAVTRGLDPDVEMKDSGVEWIGEVPAHWQVLRTRFLCDMTTGGRDTQDATDDGAYPFFVRSQTVQRIDSWSFEGEAVLTSGDGAGVGKIFHHHIGKLEYHQRVYLFHRFRRVLGRFFYYFLREHLLGVVLGGTAKSTVDSLRAPMLLDFPIAVGPIDEQRDIIEFCDDVEGRYERLTTSLNTQLDRLREYRQALITAAVTGQLDLSSEAAA